VLSQETSLTLLISKRTIMVVAKKRVVTITDDIDGRKGAETVTFAYAGRSYEIDLGEKNKAKLEKSLEPFIAAARPVGGSGGSTTRQGSAARTRSAAASADRQAVRTWAAEHGFAVSGRGRISKSILEAYARAH
jgi:hypothetical protein